MDLIDRLANFARKYHGGFRQVTEDQARDFFQVFAATTIVYQERGEVLGFAIYTEREDQILFLCIAAKKENEKNWRSVPIFMRAIENLPEKPIYYIDESMKARLLFGSGNNTSADNDRRRIDRPGTIEEGGIEGTGETDQGRESIAGKTDRIAGEAASGAVRD